jgi:nitroreductase
MFFNLTDIQQLIRRRRSVSPNAFKPRKVQRDQIEAMLEAANWAPNHGNTEPWRYKVYGGTPLEQMLETLAKIYEEYTPENIRNPLTASKILQRKETASVVIACILNKSEQSKIPEEEEVMAVACSVQNMALMATAYGMSLFWSTPTMIYKPEFRLFLELEEHQRCLGLLYIGYPNDPWPEGKRSIWLNKVSWHGF